MCGAAISRCRAPFDRLLARRVALVSPVACSGSLALPPCADAGERRSPAPGGQNGRLSGEGCPLPVTGLSST